MLRLDFSVSRKREGPTLLVHCHCGACKVGDQDGDSVCVMGRVTDTRQAGDTRWMGPGRLMDG